jgi:hypothetical protein
MNEKCYLVTPAFPDESHLYHTLYREIMCEPAVWNFHGHTEIPENICHSICGTIYTLPHCNLLIIFIYFSIIISLLWMLFRTRHETLLFEDFWERIILHLVFHFRSTFLHGYVLGLDEFAFSAPTIAGKAFAEKYTTTVNYLVYT